VSIDVLLLELRRPAGVAERRSRDGGHRCHGSGGIRRKRGSSLVAVPLHVRSFLSVYILLLELRRLAGVAECRSHDGGGGSKGAVGKAQVESIDSHMKGRPRDFCQNKYHLMLD
jgi:hypothetical protein